MGKTVKLSQSHVSENSFLVQPQPVPKEIREKMEHSADNAYVTSSHYNQVYAVSNSNSYKYAVK